MIKKSVGLVSPISIGVSPDDLGTAAYKDTGNNAGQIPLLDVNGKLNTGTIPAVAITDVFTANSEQAMLTLSAQKGDVCIRSDVNKTYLLMDDPASTLSNWVQISNTTSVVSVNNKTGAVTLDSDDVGAVSKNNAITGATKFKITYDSKGLVTAGADLQAADIPDLSSSYVSTNTAITGNTKCKITYDSKGLVTAGADLQASDIPDISSSYVATNTAITGNTKCKITYDSKGLVTSGADLQSSDIPDLSSSYVSTNTAITGNTKCKITYDSKGLVTAGADLQAGDIPDISANYVATNTAITGATKCKITYDSKGLVTAGADLQAADLPSHVHSFSDITSGTVAIANGGTGASTATNAMVNLGVVNNQELEFGGNDVDAFIDNVKAHFESNNTEYLPYIYNAKWTGHGYGVAAGVRTTDNLGQFLFLFHENAGMKFYLKNDYNNRQWVDFSWTGTTLYENSAGTAGTVTLSDSAANYKKIIIHYRDYNGYYKTVTVDDPDGKSISMDVLWHRIANTNLYLKVEQALITGSSIEIAGNKGLTRVGNNASICENGGEHIYIWKVVGYKY